MKTTQPLYRYRSLANDDLIKFVKKTLLDHELYFAPSNSFNDPFDCQPSFDEEPAKHEYIAYLERHFPNLDLTKAPWPLSAKKIEIVSDHYVQWHSEVRADLRVVCMSEVPDDILMWSHYGDNHKGICLKFDGKHSFFESFKPIEYVEDRIGFPLFSDDVDSLIRSTLTKSVHWGYEKEWRTIKFPDARMPSYEPSGIYHFEPEALVGVILGPLISEEHEALIRGGGALSARLHLR